MGNNNLGGEQVDPGTWATTVDHFRTHPEHVIAMQDEVYEFVALRDTTGATVAYLYAAGVVESYDQLEHRFLARQHEGATAESSHLDTAELDRLSAERMSNPRVSMDLPVGFVVSNADEVVRRVGDGVFVYLIDSERRRRVAMIPVDAADRLAEMDEDYLNHAAREVMSDPDNNRRLTQEEVDDMWKDGNG